MTVSRCYNEYEVLERQREREKKTLVKMHPLESKLYHHFSLVFVGVQFKSET